MIIYDNEYQFNKWVCDKVDSLDKFMSELEGPTCGKVNSINWSPGTAHTYGNFIISINKDGDTTIYNTKTGKSGKARHNPNDAMCEFLGLALAWARYNKKEIPVVKTAIKVVNLRKGDIVNFNSSTNYIVLSIVSVTETNRAIILMPWDGNKDSFYHNTISNIVIKHKLTTVDVVGHVNL